MTAKPDLIDTERDEILSSLDTQELRTRWTNGLKERYDLLLQKNIISDLPPYRAIYKLMRFLAKNGYLLDVGSLSGINTSRLAIDAGAKKVVGIDIYEKNVRDANANFEGREDLEFVFVPEDAQIPKTLGQFNGAFAGFVLPTIPEIGSLITLFDKIFEALKPGSEFIALGLDPKSFDPRNSYRYYHHKLPEDGDFQDGRPFFNELESHDGERVSFVDYCWTNETLYKLLRNAGFRNIRFVELTRNGVGEMAETLDDELTILEKQYDVEWGNEWDEGRNLYQVIRAEKPLFTMPNSTSEA